MRLKSSTSELKNVRLCWTRQDLVQATGLSYRTIRNLEQRRLLVRVAVGVNVACYSDTSVRSLFQAGTVGKNNSLKSAKPVLASVLPT